MAKTDIILCGVGGQGILSIATVIGRSAIMQNMYLKQSEVHGMSQRGGAVQSHLRISNDPVWSDLIPLGSADLILSVEPMEALRYLPWLSSGGWIVTSNQPFVNLPGYPPVEDILAELNKLPKVVLLDADDIAKKMGAPKASNMVMLGAASAGIHLDLQSLKTGIQNVFASKGDDVVTMNLKAFEAGRNEASEIFSGC